MAREVVIHICTEAGVQVVRVHVCSSSRKDVGTKVSVCDLVHIITSPGQVCTKTCVGRRTLTSFVGLQLSAKT